MASNIYLQLPDNIEPGTKVAEPYLLENNVVTKQNMGTALFNKLPSYLIFNLPEFDTLKDMWFVSNKRVDGQSMNAIFGGIWGQLAPQLAYNDNGQTKCKITHKSYSNLSFAEIGTCPIFKRDGGVTGWGVARYGAGTYYLKYDAADDAIKISTKADFSSITKTISHRKTILVELQAGGGGGGSGTGRAGLTKTVACAGGSGGSGAYSSLIINLRITGEITISVGVGGTAVGGSNATGQPTYILFKSNNYKYSISGGGPGHNATAYTAVAWASGDGGAGGSAGKCPSEFKGPAGSFRIQAIDGLNGTTGETAVGSTGLIYGTKANKRGSSYSDIFLINELAANTAIPGSAGIGWYGDFGYSQSTGGASSVLGNGGNGSSGNASSSTAGIRGGGGGGGSGVTWEGSAGGAAGGDGYLIIH